MTMQVSSTVAKLVAESKGWHTGQSKITREHFFIVPSRTDSKVAHWTCSYGCTCQGYRHRGHCAHVEAVRIVVEQATRPVAS